MKISIWNIYNQLPYPEKIPLIKNGAPTIENARWIIPRDLSPNSVYIGSAGEFFDSAENDTLIVHRYDMILIHNTEPEEAFNEVSSIIERFQKWESDLKNCCNSKNGLREMLRNSAWILQNPAFIYAPDGRALAISPDYPASIHWHWAEILKNNGLTEERMEKLQMRAVSLVDYEEHVILVGNGRQSGDIREHPIVIRTRHQHSLRVRIRLTGGLQIRRQYLADKPGSQIRLRLDVYWIDAAQPQCTES